MGNQICCEGIPTEDRISIQGLEPTQLQKKTPLTIHSELIRVKIPENVQVNLEKYSKVIEIQNLLTKKEASLGLQKSSETKFMKGTLMKFLIQIFQKGRPHGVGIIYYPNGNLLFGEFVEGKAFGFSHYFWADGSYYRGKIIDNKANDSDGFYSCDKFVYKGSFQQNLFDGLGTQTGQNYEFSGQYSKGNRVKGKLSWNQSSQSSQQKKEAFSYSYQGQFDIEGEFTGEGKLISPQGHFKGNFKSGKKNGFGVFENLNKTRYEGTYRDDIKEGKGTIYIQNNIVAYQGDFANGLPHGDGWVPGEGGKPIHLKWNEGISSQVVENKQAVEAIHQLNQ